MPENIHVNQDVLTNAADNHQEAADYLSTVAATHDGIRATLRSLGPIYGDFSRAADSLLEARKDCYDDQASEHSTVSENLHLAVETWNNHEANAARVFRGISDGR